MRLIQHSRNGQQRLTPRAMALDISSLSIHNMRHAHPRVSPVRVAVDDGRIVHSPVGSDRVHAFIPMDMAREEEIHTARQHGRLERIADVLFIGCAVGAVHRTMCDRNDPRGLGAIDGCEVGGQPLDLLVGGDVVEVSAVYVAEGTGVRDEGFAGSGERFAGADVALEGVFGGVAEEVMLSALRLDIRTIWLWLTQSRSPSRRR